MEGSDPPLLCHGDNLGREGRLDHGPAASNMSPTEVNSVSRESSIQPDQGMLSCPNKGHFLRNAIFILNFRARFYFSLSPAPLGGPGNWDIPSSTAGEEPVPGIRFHGWLQGSSKVSLADKLREQGKRLLSFSLFSLIQLLSDLYSSNKHTHPCFSLLGSWPLIANSPIRV